jgi:hypothetical protein
MIITKKRLPRRTFLRGLGVTVGLPLLDGMIPALATAADVVAKPVTRMSFMYVPNGIMNLQHEWSPAKVGALEITPILEPLTAFRDHLLVLSGLSHPEGRPQPGEGGGDHSRASTRSSRAFMQSRPKAPTCRPELRSIRLLRKNSASTPNWLRSSSLWTQPRR